MSTSVEAALEAALPGCAEQASTFELDAFDEMLPLLECQPEELAAPDADRRSRSRSPPLPRGAPPALRPDARDEADPYAALLAGLEPTTVGRTSEAVLAAQPVDTDRLAAALCARALAEPQACANLAVLLVERLPLGHRRSATCGPSGLVAGLVQRCHGQPQLGCVVFLGELFKRQLVGLAELEALFGLVGPDLACELLLVAGAFLDKSASGRRVLDAAFRGLGGLGGPRAALCRDLRAAKWRPAVAAERRKSQVELVGKLFLQKRVAQAAVQQLFRQLLRDPSASNVDLALQLLRLAGPTLDGSEQGWLLVECVLLRLKQLADPALAPGIAEVAQLRARAWSTAGHGYRSKPSMRAAGLAVLAAGRAPLAAAR